MLCPHCPRQVMTHLKKPQKDARLSRQAQEHLYNQAAQGQLRGRKGMKTLTKHQNLPSQPYICQNVLLETGSCTKVLDQQPDVKKPSLLQVKNEPASGQDYPRCT